MTGNVFIETYQRSRGQWVKSGINVSTAGWWAIEVYDERWVILRRTALKALAERAPTKRGGDNDNYRGRLVPVEWLTQPWRPT